MNTVFIGGTGRSGSNILKDFLISQDEVTGLPFEHRFTIDPFGIVDTYVNLKYLWSPYLCDIKIKKLLELLNSMGVYSEDKNLPYAKWELSNWFPLFHQRIKELENGLFEFVYEANWPGKNDLETSNMTFSSQSLSKLKFVFGAFIRDNYNDYLTNVGAEIFVEDNTWNLLYGQFLNELLPESKFIHMVRDPRDVVYSLMNQRWTPNKLENCIRYYSELMDRIFANLERIDESIYLQVRLEDLLYKESPEWQKLERFLGVTLIGSSDFFNFEKANLNSWKLLSNHEKITLNTKLKPYLFRLGYL